MYLHVSINPSHGLAHVCYSSRMSCRVRLSRVLATPPSSILLQVDESNDLPKTKKGFCLSEDSKNSLNGLSADSLLRQANTVGIIGGLSTESTLKFVKKLVDWSSKNGKSSLPFVLCSDPALNKELLLYEENSYPSLYYRAESTPVDPKQIVENLRNKRRSLERCGAKLILMPCHTAHIWYEEVCEGSSVPLLHMGECIAKELEEAKMKPLEAGNSLRVGVMASSATLSAGFYQEKLQSNVWYFLFFGIIWYFLIKVLLSIIWSDCVIVEWTGIWGGASRQGYNGAHSDPGHGSNEERRHGRSTKPSKDSVAGTAGAGGKCCDARIRWDAWALTRGRSSAKEVCWSNGCTRKVCHQMGRESMLLREFICVCVCLYICEKKYSSGGVALASVKPVFTIPKSQHV